MPDLPSGTVTFLFTDIEGSTALWERDRAAMAAAVERHLALLRTAIETHGGVLFKIVGDAVQAAFPPLPAAVAAAVAAQRALQAEPWSDPPGPLHVRMALHAGEAVPRDGDYLAAPLNRLARLLAAGHGGQILVTEVVERLVEGALPAGRQPAPARHPPPPGPAGAGGSLSGGRSWAAGPVPAAAESASASDEPDHSSHGPHRP